MPDNWENYYGLDKTNSSDGNDVTVINGYTNLENYLNARALSADIDADGIPDNGDCSSDDATIYPGADDIYNDGIISDCNNANDPVITIYKAAYSSKKKTLEIEAITPEGQNDRLTVDGADMDWNNKQGGRWKLKASYLTNPGTVTIRGDQGYIILTL